jgi:NADH-quinone oxidoreductase subunit A
LSNIACVTGGPSSRSIALTLSYALRGAVPSQEAAVGQGCSFGAARCHTIVRIGSGYPCTNARAALTLAALQHARAVIMRERERTIIVRTTADTAPSADLRSMNELLGSYLPIVIFIGVALFVGLALLVAPFLVAYRNPDPEKLSAYECGFNAFDDARMKFDVRFYLVAILFIIFDLEVAFLFPWAISFGEIGWLGFWSMMAFLGVLTIGFIYEWKKGALEWD